ncbi:MAG: hypothetical protein AB8G15_18170, partial [Saprospiraceae bacterium]
KLAKVWKRYRKWLWGGKPTHSHRRPVFGQSGHSKDITVSLVGCRFQQSNTSSNCLDLEKQPCTYKICKTQKFHN